MAISDDPAALAAAFRDARYRVPELGDDGDMHVGTVAIGLESALAGGRFAFITAWNSGSRAGPPMGNDAADRALDAALDRLGTKRRRAFAEDAHGGHREAGWMVLDLPIADLDRLAREFDQHGTLAWARGTPIRLRMYHRCPPHAPSDPWTDWVE